MKDVITYPCWGWWPSWLAPCDFAWPQWVDVVPTICVNSHICGYWEGIWSRSLISGTSRFACQKRQAETACDGKHLLDCVQQQLSLTGKADTKLNSSRLGDRCIHQWAVSLLVQVMGWRRIGAKPLPEPILTNNKLHFGEQTSVKFESKYHFFFQVNAT